MLGAARESSVDLAESELMKAIRAGNMTAIIFFLKTQGRSRGYVERSDHDFTASGMPSRMRTPMRNPIRFASDFTKWVRHVLQDFDPDSESSCVGLRESARGRR